MLEATLACYSEGMHTALRSHDLVRGIALAEVTSAVLTNVNSSSSITQTGFCTGLVELHASGLGGLQATLLPSLAALTRLTAVELNSCSLTAFPALLCTLPDLASLSLADNSIQVWIVYDHESQSLRVDWISNPCLPQDQW